jgi:putative flippase GtrA
MADLEPRRGSGRVTSRRQREQRAYRLVVAGGTAAVVAVVGLVLAALGVVGAGIPIVAAVIAVVCLVMVRRMVGSR